MTSYKEKAAINTGLKIEEGKWYSLDNRVYGPMRISKVGKYPVAYATYVVYDYGRWDTLNNHSSLDGWFLNGVPVSNGRNLMSEVKEPVKGLKYYRLEIEDSLENVKFDSSKFFKALDAYIDLRIKGVQDEETIQLTAKEMRRQLGWTQVQMAKAIGISKSAYQVLETKKMQPNTYLAIKYVYERNIGK